MDNSSKKGSKNDDPFANWHSAVSEIDDPAVLEAFRDALEDVHTRFLLNLPEEELATADRILFQIEQAWWFYEDWICDQQDLNISGALPRFKHLKPFAVEMFQISPILDNHKFFAMWETFSQYKRKISTYGCILLNQDCNKIVLCQDWNSKSWTFPAGKINQGEVAMDAAARETWEETGFDPNGKYGITQQMNATWRQPLQEKDAVAFTEDSGKRRTYYICHGVPEDFPFDPVARKEVSAVAWHPLEKVPKKNYAVLPILPKVKRWIKRNVTNVGNNNNNKQKTPKKQRDKSKGRHGSPKKQSQQQQQHQENATPLKSNKTPSRKEDSNKKTPNRDRKKQGSRPLSRGKRVAEDNPLLETGLAEVGSQDRWTEEDMFAVNEKLIGRKVEYDGNPHVFSEQGFQGMDPHHFHVVGGTFLNSDTNALAPPPPTSRLQHLFRTKSQDGSGDDEGGEGGGASAEVLTPFFSDEGATPWGEVVEEVKDTVVSPTREMMLTKDSDLNKINKKGGNKNKKQQGKNKPKAIMATADNDSDLVFMTDQEITKRSQQIKLAEWNATNELERKYQQDLQDIQDWVNNLPQAAPTKHFGEFKFDVDALMEAYYQHY